MWALLPIGWSLTVRFAATAAVTALAAATLVAVAALVEGHPPRASALWMAAPVAGLCAAGWTLGSWRAGREDVALAALGVPPAVAAAWVVLLAAPLLWTGGDRPATAAWTLALAPGEVTARGPDGEWRWRWTAGGVVVESADPAGPLEDAAGPIEDAAGPIEDAAGPIEDAAGPIEDAAASPPLPGAPAPAAADARLTPPTTRSPPPAPPSPWPAYALRLAAAALLAAWLLARAAPPGPAAVVAGATIAFVGSHLLARLT